MTNVAIIGAGISGLACADRLRRGGITPTLFDKGKRPGGRLSTLRIDAGEWDFGAQYLQRGDGAFAAKVSHWQHSGVVAQWPAGPPGALVGIPAMASLVEAECAAHDVRFGALVQRIMQRSGQWWISGAELDEGPFAAVVLAIPAQQASPILSLHDLHLAREAATHRSQPCWTLMLAFAEPLAGVPDYIRASGPIAEAARNNSKPGRPAGECWVIQADADWSKRHLEQDPAVIADALLQAFADAAGLDQMPAPTFAKAHRWRFAVSHAGHDMPLWNAQLRLGACGDWCAKPLVAGAWQSGQDLAELVMAELLVPEVDRVPAADDQNEAVERVAGIEPA
ncbi:MAG: NAD(P)-binding protein [Novosphingobium sp.]|uniref:NAD(P)/FAD-dependent oxidoreductase n=1 Tax=Novosphingobium sp. TaxID=1874826 RepID=UPI003C7C41F6